MALLLGLCCSLGGWAGLTAARGDVTRVQTIPVRAGWNAVYLEVQPVASKPAEVFAGLPVETVACFYPGRLEARYLRNPGDAPWREEGWAVWHAPSRPDAFLSNLGEIQAQRPLLILASADFTWTVTGEARATLLEWYPNTCTLTGLPVDPTAPPTFAQFFEGSAGHERLRIFRLDAGNWKLVSAPASERPRRGEAYWIETDGASSHQGPLRVRLPASGEVDFGPQGGAYSLEIINESKVGSQRVLIEVEGGSPSLPLRRVARDLARQETVREPFAGTREIALLPPGGKSSLWLEPHRAAMTASSGSTLLKISTDRGTQIWVPVRARYETAAPSLSNP